jgi:Stage II sporulation protein E (SpoIIE)
MSTHQPPKVAGINPPAAPPEQTTPPSSSPSPVRRSPETGPAAAEEAGERTDRTYDPGPGAGIRPVDQLARLTAVQDRLACRIADLTTLHDLTGRLARATTLDATLHETLRAGADLAGARRGLITLEPTDRLGPVKTVGLGLGQADLGQIETIPHSPLHNRLLDGPPGPEQHAGIIHPDIAEDDGLDPRHREVAARLGYAASYAVPLIATDADRRTGAAFWLYDEPAQPTERQRRLLGRYLRRATEHITRQIAHARTESAAATVHEELLPSRLPRVPGVRLAVRHRTGPRGGGDWYDVLPLPEGALGLSVGGVTGSGPSPLAAMGRLRASLRAYAVMEGEDPVAVLSDLELLMRVTEPARCATALFGYAEPAERRVVIAGAGHCPPLIVGPRRCAFAETTLSAPLGMLDCWEVPSMELVLEDGETLLLYSDGLIRRTGEPMDQGFARLRAAALNAEPAVRDDPDTLADHVLYSVLPDGRADTDSAEDVVLLVSRF